MPLHHSAPIHQPVADEFRFQLLEKEKTRCLSLQYLICQPAADKLHSEKTMLQKRFACFSYWLEKNRQVTPHRPRPRDAETWQERRQEELKLPREQLAFYPDDPVHADRFATDHDHTLRLRDLPDLAHLGPVLATVLMGVRHEILHGHGCAGGMRVSGEDADGGSWKHGCRREKGEC